MGMWLYFLFKKDVYEWLVDIIFVFGFELQDMQLALESVIKQTSTNNAQKAAANDSKAEKIRKAAPKASTKH